MIVMIGMKELERTHLAKFLPDDLTSHRSDEIIDIYIPETRAHPTLRIRKRGDVFEITKKSPIGRDSSIQLELTIQLDAEEFAALCKAGGKVVRKIRYYYKHGGRIFEFDVFQDGLKGLVMIDVEFSDEKDMDSFDVPGFCLADVTQEEFAAGGMLCGKSYKDIENDLKRFGYNKLTTTNE